MFITSFPFLYGFFGARILGYLVKHIALILVEFYSKKIGVNYGIKRVKSSDSV